MLRTRPMVPILPLLVMAVFRFQPLGVTVIPLVLALLELWMPFLLGAWGAERFNVLGLRTMNRLVIHADFITLFVLVANQERFSHRDALTGIANRRRFEQVLQRKWVRARQGGPLP